jgi:hypothetical protein
VGARERIIHYFHGKIYSMGRSNQVSEGHAAAAADAWPPRSLVRSLTGDANKRWMRLLRTRSLQGSI